MARRVDLNDVRVLLAEYIRKTSRLGILFSTYENTGQVKSIAENGLPPLIVSSNTLVPNLNADLLDGFHASEFATVATVSSIVADVLPDTLIAGSGITLSVGPTTVTIHTDGIGGAVHSSLGGLGADDHTQYHNDSRALTWLGTRSTTDLPEGSNQYYTDEKVDDRVAALVIGGSGIATAYNDAGGTLTVNATLVSHTHVASDITDFSEAVDDRVSSLVVAGSGVTLSYNDAGNSLTVHSAGSGGALAIGNSVTGGGANRVLYEDGAQTLAASSSFTFDGASLTLPLSTSILAGSLSILSRDNGSAITSFGDLSNNGDLVKVVAASSAGNLQIVKTDGTVMGQFLHATGNPTGSFQERGDIIASGIVMVSPGVSGYVLTNMGNDRGLWQPTVAGVTDHGALTGLADDDHTQYHTDARALTWLGTRSTTDLPEGSNQYFTDEKVDDRVAALLVPGSGVVLSYNDPSNTLTINVIGSGVTDHTALTNLNSTSYTHLTSVQALDLTDAGDSALHFHPTDRDRSNHTGTQLASTISDFAESVDDRVDALLVPGSGIVKSYNDSANTLTLNVVASGVTDHAALTNLNSLAYTHLTSTQAGDLTDGGDSTLHFHATDRDRSNHTGTQVASTISDFSEAVDDRVDALLIPGSGITKSYNDSANTLTLNIVSSGVTFHGVLTGLGSDDHLQYHTDSRALTWLGTRSTTDLPEGTNQYFTDERVDDRVAGLLVAGSGIVLSYNDPSNILTVNVIASGVTDHTALTNLNSVSYTHLTSAQATDLTDAGDSTLHFHATDRDRANHTGTQTASTISDFAEVVDDRVDALLVGGSGVVLSYNDAGDTLTIHTSTEGATDHGTLGGLADDDHTQYARTDGARNITGDQTFEQDVIVQGSGLLSRLRVQQDIVTSAFTMPTGSVSGYIMTSLNGGVAQWQSPVTGVTDHGLLTGLGDDDHTQYHTDARALTWLGTRSTTDLPEGTNQYFTNERVDDRVAALVVGGSGVTTAYDDTGGFLTVNATEEFVEDVISNLIVGGSGVAFSYNDATGSLTINANTLALAGSGIVLAYDSVAGSLTINAVEEFVQDVTSSLLVGGSGISTSYNDAVGTLTVNSNGTASSLNGQAGSFYLDRTNHTGTQTASTISDFAEAVDDRVDTLVVAGSGLSKSYNDAGNTYTLDVSYGEIDHAQLTNLNSATHSHLTSTQLTDLTDAGDSALHFHTTDRDRSNHTGTQIASTVSDFTEAAQDAVAAALVGASGVSVSYNDAGNTITINGPTNIDAATLGGQAGSYYLSRTNHTGTQTASTVSDFSEAVDDRMVSLLIAGSGISAIYNDAANTLTVNVIPEFIQDVSANIVVGGSGVTTSYNDVGDTLTLNVSPATIDHATLSNLNSTTYSHITSTQVTDLTDGNDSTLHFHATDRDRANHTGTQASTTISDFTEASQDATAAFLVAGSGVVLSHNDAGNTLTINTFAGGAIDHGTLSGLGDDDHTQYHTDARALTWLGTRSTTDLPEGTNQYFTDERVDDRVAALLVQGSGVTLTYNDGGNTLTVHSTSDHGSLGGLADDDHAQYARTDGTRNITGDQIFEADIVVQGSGIIQNDLRHRGNSIYELETATFSAEFDNGNSGTADTVNWRVAQKQRSTLSDNVTFTFNPPDGPCNLILKLIQGGAGAFTVTWPSGGTGVRWPGGTAPTVNTAAGTEHIIAFYFDGTKYYGVGSTSFS